MTRVEQLEKLQLAKRLTIGGGVQGGDPCDSRTSLEPSLHEHAREGAVGTPEGAREAAAREAGALARAAARDAARELEAAAREAAAAAREAEAAVARQKEEAMVAAAVEEAAREGRAREAAAAAAAAEQAAEATRQAAEAEAVREKAAQDARSREEVMALAELEVVPAVPPARSSPTRGFATPLWRWKSDGAGGAAGAAGEADGAATAAQKRLTIALAASAAARAAEVDVDEAEADEAEVEVKVEAEAKQSVAEETEAQQAQQEAQMQERMSPEAPGIEAREVAEDEAPQERSLETAAPSPPAAAAAIAPAGLWSVLATAAMRALGCLPPPSAPTAPATPLAEARVHLPTATYLTPPSRRSAAPLSPPRPEISPPELSPPEISPPERPPGCSAGSSRCTADDQEEREYFPTPGGARHAVRLMAEGHAAIVRGELHRARRRYLESDAVLPRAAARISAANVSLKLGESERAAAEFHSAIPQGGPATAVSTPMGGGRSGRASANGAELDQVARSLRRAEQMARARAKAVASEPGQPITPETARAVLEPLGWRRQG